MSARAVACALLSACFFGPGCADKTRTSRVIAGTEPARGLVVIDRVGCAACHRIPGVDWPAGTVGGSLAGFADRSLIAGRFPNQPETLVVWVKDASALSTETGMPPMAITDAEARDIAAYLYTLHER